MWAIGLAVFLLGIIFIIIAPINKRKNNRCSAQTNGMLINSYRTMSSKGAVRYRYVYSYFVDGIEYQITSTIQSKEAARMGDYCTIWYNPKNPKDAQPFHYESTNVYTIILILGFVLVLLGIILILVGAAKSW